tara:strand:+ start:179 stop:574 length:396 start_codon:yes stop_codon:yes gene_type:complete
MRLTTNFWLEEFQCKDGSEMPIAVFRKIEILAKQLQVIRDVLNVPMTLTSAYRSPSHNRAIGGVKSSQHLLGTACDIQVKGMSSQEVYDTIEMLIEEGSIKNGGLGLYYNFVHYDVRGYKARWNFTKNDKG